MSEPPRAAAMARRLAHSALGAGIDAAGEALILRCYGDAMERRRGVLPDEHHPEFLHPARTQLILLEDVGMSDADVLGAAALLDTRRPALTAGREHARRLAGERVAALLEEVPLEAESPEALLEMLLCVSHDACLIALAERLDHARHIHLVPGAPLIEYHAEVERVFLPLAGRAEPMLHRRFERWAGAFRKRYLR